MPRTVVPGEAPLRASGLVAPADVVPGTTPKPALPSCVAPHAVQQRTEEAVRQRIGVLTRPKPRVGPVGGGEREQRRRRVVEVGPQVAQLASFAKERAEPLLVASPFGDERVAPLAFEVAPLADEDG